MAWRIPVFRIFYSSTFLIFVGILLVLLAVTPGDHIYQTIDNGKLGNVFVVGGVYIGAFLIALFIYFSRLYTNRATLSSIPKPYLPIDSDEVPSRVYREIVRNRHRSSLIAWESKPKDLSGKVQDEHVDGAGEELTELVTATDDDGDDDGSPMSRQVLNEKDEATEKSSESKFGSVIHRPFRYLKHLRKIKTLTPDKSMDTKKSFISIDPANPPWGLIIHPGWSSPSTIDLPNLQFDVVIDELPNLIEAKAVSLAPPDPAYARMQSYKNLRKDASMNIQRTESPTDLVPPDERAVAVLQRPVTMSLKDYVTHLGRLGMIDPPKIADSFLEQYEYARFSTEILYESEFRELMVAFSDLLGAMLEVAPDVLIAEAELIFGANEEDDDDYEDDTSLRDVSFAKMHRPISGQYSTEESSPLARRPTELTEDDTGSILHHSQHPVEEHDLMDDAASVIHRPVSQSRTGSSLDSDAQSFQTDDSVPD